MKQIKIKLTSFLRSRILLLLAGIFIGFLNPVTSLAQTENATEEEAAAPPEEELISPTIQFISIQKGDQSIRLRAIVKAKIEKKMRKLYGLKINFFQVTDEGDQDLGAVITDRNGVAVLDVKPEQVVVNKEGMVHFKSVLGPVKKVEATEEEITFKRAILTITPSVVDSVYTVQAKLVDLSSGTETPIPEVALGIFVKRSFYPLKLGEGTTDENGETSVEIPYNLPGDAAGNVTLLAKLDEDENFGYLEGAAVEKWGTPVSDKIQDQPRALWSSHPPLWMLITFIILMAAVWGHYIVIVYELFRLRKEEPNLNATNS